MNKIQDFYQVIKKNLKSSKNIENIENILNKELEINIDNMHKRLAS